MKATNKIYVPILPRIENSIVSEHYVGTAWDNKEHITIPDVEEYIRKDALMEWLKKQYESSIWYYEEMKHVTGCVGDTSSSGKAEAYKEIIEKIESL